MDFLLDHWDLLTTVLGAALTVYKVTRWGKAKSRGLVLVAEVIEALKEVDADQVKKTVSEKQAGAPPEVQDAINDAVATVDPKKPTPTSTTVAIREVMRVIRKKVEEKNNASA